ncbi:hypothetical protein D3C72_1958590 [compost metagenome]
MDLPVLFTKLDACMLGHCCQMRLGIGRSADCRIDADRVQKRLARHDVGRLDILDNQFNSAAAGAICHLAAFTVSRRDCAAAGERHAERFGNRIHGRGRAHGVAVTDRRSGFERRLQKFLAGDFTGAVFAAHAPDDGTGTDEIAVMIPVEHRPAG